MWTSQTSVFLAVWPLLVNAENSSFSEYTNGWVPVSSELVRSQLSRVGATSPQYTAAHSIQLLHTDVNQFLPLNVLKIPEEIDGNSKGVGNKCHAEGINCSHAKTNNMQSQESPHNFVSDIVYHSSKQSKNNSVVRRSKMIADLNFPNAQELFFPENSSPKKKERTYEVTEDTLEFDEFSANSEGYNYEPSKKKNQTNVLFDILSKYKIKKDDELQNYILSRKHKTQISQTSISSTEKHNQFLYRYNNLNHLPIDPVLAVLLSNYGFHLRGVFGARNSYNNLYGYLASNNIHNNRPFRAYKIYSDTDSSH